MDVLYLSLCKWFMKTAEKIKGLIQSQNMNYSCQQNSLFIQTFISWIYVAFHNIIHLTIMCKRTNCSDLSVVAQHTDGTQNKHVFGATFGMSPAFKLVPWCPIIFLTWLLERLCTLWVWQTHMRPIAPCAWHQISLFFFSLQLMNDYLLIVLMGVPWLSVKDQRRVTIDTSQQMSSHDTLLTSWGELPSCLAVNITCCVTRRTTRHRFFSSGLGLYFMHVSGRS